MRVVAEHYRADGSVDRVRTTMRKWQKIYESMPKPANEFVLLWWKHQRRWDGARRKELHSAYCQEGFHIEWTEGYASGQDFVAPVLVADD